MKTKLSLVLILFSLAVQIDARAQVDVSKSELLSAMNNFDGLGLSSKEESELRETNNKIVDNVLGIANNDEDDESKLKMLKDAKSNNLRMFEGILDDKKLKKYKKNVKKKLRPLKRKAKFVKFLL